jgi:hypothetical protein
MGQEEVVPTTKRVSLTKAQRTTAVGAELLSLCQTITSDGSLSAEEVEALRDWLDANRTEELPSIDHLVTVVQQIIADGMVTAEERRELFKAIETVLPADVRSIAKNARRTVEQAEKDRLKLQGELKRQQAREERERNRPIYQLDVMVAGAKYEGRPQVIRRHVRTGDQVHLVRDPGNRHSRSAVAIHTHSGHHIGFVPNDDAVEIAPLLDEGHAHRASVKKILTGSSHPIPVVVADIYGRDATITNVQAPASPLRSPSTPSVRATKKVSGWSWLIWIATIVLGLILIKLG